MKNRQPAQQRSEQILRLLQQSGEISAENLCSVLKVSIATVRRDLDELDQRGLLRRTHGGAKNIEPLLYEPFHDSSFREQMELHAAEKRRIAIAAADLIQDGETICLAPGTTTTEVVRSLRHRKNITVVVNSVNMAMELSQHEDLRVVVIGGALRPNWFSLVGPLTELAMQQIFPDKLFLGVTGIHPERGLSCRNADAASAIRVMIRNAKQTIVVADHSKLQAVSTYQICPVEDVDLLITDSEASAAMIETLRASGVEVCLV
jgi:DeoR family transcriptional regulator of aga operon